MDKISSILPPTARITSVDLKNSGTARSGMPSYGRPQLELTGTPRREAEEMAAMTTNKTPRQDPHLEIVDRISNEFFMKKSAPAESELAINREEIFDANSDLDPMTESPVDVADPLMALGAPENSMESIEEDLDAPAVGGNLDVEV